MSERPPAPGGLALLEALVNTLDIETGADSLDTADGRAPFGLAEPDVPAARDLREALRAALKAHAGHDVPTAELGRLLAAAPLLVAIDPAGAAEVRPADPADLASRVAAAVAAASADGSWLRLKACEAADCQWAYYDRSPAGRSRWCTMAVCGSRAKMRKYRARRADPA
ncbi:MAG TPA: CGNR zinc finger domain-containing protein [Streptomyces sp.]|nr:CGNR zinc finger domain-containing protein [Streptomyces sp.]